MIYDRDGTCSININSAGAEGQSSDDSRGFCASTGR